MYPHATGTFEEKGVPFNCRVYRACKVTQGIFCNHCKKNHQGKADQPVDSRISLSAQDFMLRHFAQASIAEVETRIDRDVPSDKEVGADALCAMGIQWNSAKLAGCCGHLCRQARHCFAPSSEVLSRQVAQIESEMKGKDKMIIEVRGTVDKLTNAVDKRQRCAQRCQAESEGQARWHKEEHVRLHVRMAVLEAGLVACRRPPFKPVSVFPSISGY